MNDATPKSVTTTPLMDRLDGFQAGLSWAVICPSMQTPWTRCMPRPV